ncbi:phosphate ABC transporter permease PstA [Jatrophihabitans telluris]|uniref:Phosphate transport system permease protein PstA n=1 Tax=Jatrophihabitans telluris TaxID=2038343 RepID=A0ABY4QXK7_9ACTN|nr:phosphate ABC transporter permease PstA [Jatrophihabitans telluris]UQX88406.1 phosphate ABC transporter permease PstA [Jatrophihabitans telluris]
MSEPTTRGSNVLDPADNHRRIPAAPAGPIAVEPFADQRSVDLPLADQRSVDRPVVDRPVVVAPTGDQPLADQPLADQPIVDEPFAAAPLVQAPADVPRELGHRTLDGTASLLGSIVGSLALTWLVYEGMLAFSGVVGFALSWWAVFVLLYALVSRMAHPWIEVQDRLISVVVTSGATLVGLALASTLIHVFVKGWPALHHLNFYTHDMSGVRPTAPLTEGGVSHAITGSALQVGIAVVISLPLGVGTAVYMTEVGGRLSQTVRTVVEAMTALPDILAGLFVYTVLIIALHWDRTGLTAALALVVTIIPIIARSAEVSLRVVPNGLREASLALGASQWQTVRRVVLPTARSGLATALILGVARIAGETAPLLIVSGASTYFNRNPISEPMNSLPLFIITAVRSGQPLFIARGYGAAALLLLIVLVLFAAARFFSRNRGGSR